MEKPKFPELNLTLPNGRSLFVCTIGVKCGREDVLLPLVPTDSASRIRFAIADTLSVHKAEVLACCKVGPAPTEFDCDFPEDGQPCGKCAKCVERMTDTAQHNFGRD